MKRVRYTKFTGDLASEMDIEDLLKALSDYLLDSGFRDPYLRFQDMDHTLDDLREALRQLESEGLIAMIPNKGPVVRELTLEESKDLYSIRAVLEGLAARLFVKNANDALVKKLEKSLNRTSDAYKSDDPESILETKNSFYDVLFEGAGSETLSLMIATLHGRIWRWRALGLGHPRRSEKRWKESIRGLRAMLAAIGFRCRLGRGQPKLRGVAEIVHTVLTLWSPL